jgi:hypothetical protein
MMEWPAILVQLNRRNFYSVSSDICGHVDNTPNIQNYGVLAKTK